ncbi:hypothetical protein [Neptuniibacter caesariensis]|uniref:Uncharacterized protein n=1 Tax=Neptuniibacter caesariensis TaxID=207954 RepID=A0A7U8GR85_NEPCE|nr:hypothetical protein [Neptuniibacter caesariensis]EAR61092.1 hypothetical protein MED92_01744 [Neptuniibacter caesariensis]
MTYTIDAWFERENPYLKVIHRKTGISVLNWQGETLKRKILNGAINVEDFNQPPSQELVKELFLLDCLDQEQLRN